MISFTDQAGRIERIVHNALDGTTFEAARSEEGGRHLVIEALRSNGERVTVRFRAVQDAEATSGTQAGSPLRPRRVIAGPTGCLPLGWLFPQFRGIPRGVCRVRIEAGSARLDIVCQDAEWWEDEPQPGRTT